MTKEEISVIKNRLTVNYLTRRTSIFTPMIGAEQFDIKTAQLISDRFEQYWKTWVEDELEKVFSEIEKPEGHEVSA